MNHLVLCGVGLFFWGGMDKHDSNRLDVLKDTQSMQIMAALSCPVSHLNMFFLFLSFCPGKGFLSLDLVDPFVFIMITDIFG